MPKWAAYVVLAVAGFVLMFGAHFAAFAARNLPLPYWWSFLIFYPLTTALVVRQSRLSAVAVAAAVCFFPLCYFLALGVFESNWTASSTAIVGAGLAFVLSAAVGSWVQARRAQ